MSRMQFGGAYNSNEPQRNDLRQFMNPSRSASQSNYRTGAAQSGGGNRQASPMAGLMGSGSGSGNSYFGNPLKTQTADVNYFRDGVRGGQRTLMYERGKDDSSGVVPVSASTGQQLGNAANNTPGRVLPPGSGGYVKSPYKPELFANASPLPDGPRPPLRQTQMALTEDAFADFNAEARRLAAQPREDLYKETSRIISEGVEAGRQQGIVDANKSVDDRLAARQGYYPTPGQRSSGFYARGMGPLPSDAAIGQRQGPQLGTGGQAAAAAREDQAKRRAEAEAAMAQSGQPSDGLKRYRPNSDLLAYANAERSKEDRDRFSALQAAGLFPSDPSGTSPGPEAFMRDPMQSMTPDEIRFYRHKMNMATNPTYRDRIESQRSNRAEILQQRNDIGRARRQGAIEAAGASQQLRNLMAGRGALGAGRDGFGALMSMAAMQNPNQAFGDYGQAYGALTAPDMQAQRLGAEERMYGAGLQNQQALQTEQLGAQQKMQDSMIAGNKDLAQLSSQARAAELASQQAFMQASQATSFEQQKEFQELGARLKRDSETREMQIDILTDPNIPQHQKAQMMQAAADPTTIGSPELASLMRPQFVPDTSRTKMENYQAAQQYFATHNVPPQEQQAILQQNNLILSDDDRQRAYSELDPYGDFRGIDAGDGNRTTFSWDPGANYAANVILRMIGQDAQSINKRNRLRDSLMPSAPTPPSQANGAASPLESVGSILNGISAGNTAMQRLLPSSR